jgi:hypothetical protein
MPSLLRRGDTNTPAQHDDIKTKNTERAAYYEEYSNSV